MLAALLGIAKGRTDDGERGYSIGAAALGAHHWRSASSAQWHGYRWIEALFGGNTMAERFRNLRQTCETPEAILIGSAAPALAATDAMPGQTSAFMGQIRAAIISRFAWADGITAHLSYTCRHAPILLALGESRPPARWPKGAETSWPERYARAAIREVGLPPIRITPDESNGSII